MGVSRPPTPPLLFTANSHLSGGCLLDWRSLYQVGRFNLNDDDDEEEEDNDDDDQEEDDDEEE